MCFRIKKGICLCNPSDKSVNEDIAIITFIKIDFSTNRWNTKRIAVTPYSRNNASNKMACSGVIWSTKTQCIHRCNRTGAHCKDITQNTTDTCRRPLIRFNIRRMVMTFHFENNTLSFTNIDNTSIFTRPLNDTLPFCWKSFEPFFRRFIGTMFVPHCRKNSQFSKCWFSPD